MADRPTKAIGIAASGTGFALAALEFGPDLSQGYWLHALFEQPRYSKGRLNEAIASLEAIEFEPIQVYFHPVLVEKALPPGLSHYLVEPDDEARMRLIAAFEDGELAIASNLRSWIEELVESLPADAGVALPLPLSAIAVVVKDAKPLVPFEFFSTGPTFSSQLDDFIGDGGWAGF